MDQGDAAGGVSGCVCDGEGEGIEGEGVAVVEVSCEGWCGDGESDRGGEVEHWVGEPGFFDGVEVDGCVRETRACFEESCDVIRVCVGEEDLLDNELLLFYSVEEGLRVVSAIDDPAVLSGCWWAIGDDVAVGLEVSEGENLDGWCA